MHFLSIDTQLFLWHSLSSNNVPPITKRCKLQMQRKPLVLIVMDREIVFPHHMFKQGVILHGSHFRTIIDFEISKILNQSLFCLATFCDKQGIPQVNFTGS